MKKISINPREHWKEKCEDDEFYFHSIDGYYWDESHAIEFSSNEIDTLTQASNELHCMCLDLVQDVVIKGEYDKYKILPHCAQEIEKSWKRKDFHLYGRFDLSFNGNNIPKLLEYNADTPLCLLEAAKIQNSWYKEQAFQFSECNEITNSLIAHWKDSKQKGKIPSIIHFASDESSAEEWGAVQYLCKTALSAGLEAHYLSLQQIELDKSTNKFFDNLGRPINSLFKLHPWEYLIEDEFYPYFISSGIQIIEPMWKMLLSNKAILPLLWQKYPNHPNLLPAFFHEDQIKKLNVPYVKKPFLSREGDSTFFYDKNGMLEESISGEYGKEGFIYQARQDLVKFNNTYAVIGSSIVDNKMSGIGIREDNSLITGKLTGTFIPHYIKN